MVYIVTFINTENDSLYNFTIYTVVPEKNNKNQIFYFHLGNDLHLAQCFE